MPPDGITWVPPDGGWGWVIVVCSVLLHMHTTGTIVGLGVMYVSWLDTFGVGRGVTSWIISVAVAITFGLAPIPAALANRYGFRLVVIVGGLLTSAGYILSFFATSVTYLIITIGLITGLGCCFGYLSAVVVVSDYFDKRRPFAMGIATTGASLGAFVSGPLLNYLINLYGWRGTILIMGAYSLHMCVYGLLLRPLKTITVGEETCIEIIDSCVECENQSLLLYEKKDTVNVNGDVNEDLSKIPAIVIEEVNVSLMSTDCSKVNVSVPPIQTNGSFLASELTNTVKTQESVCDLSNVDKVPELRNSMKSMSRLEGKTLKHHSNVQPYSSLEDHDTDMKRYHQNDDESQTHFCIIKNIIVKSYRANTDLLKDPIFLQFVISNIFTALSFIIPVMYLVDRADEEGLGKSVGAMLISWNGIGGIFGRLFFGAVTYRLFQDRLLTYIIVLSLAGIFTMLSPLCGSNVYLHCIYAALIGCFLGGFSTLVAVINTDLMGLTKASESFGLLLTFVSVTTLTGPPFAGLLFDWTRSYTVSYVLFGFFLVISAFILIPACYIRRRRNKREMNWENKNKTTKTDKETDFS